jgi:hypothetical protein
VTLGYYPFPYGLITVLNLADVVCLVEEVLYLAIIVNNMLFYQLCVERIHGVCSVMV